MFLAREFSATVFATDLWISPTDNYRRFQEMGLENQIVPLLTETTALPFIKAFTATGKKRRNDCGGGFRPAKTL